MFKNIRSRLETMPVWSQRILAGLLVISALVGFVYVCAYVIRFVGFDFEWVFYPVAQYVLFDGMSPYVNYHYVYVPWGIVPLLPLAWFPLEIASALYFLAGVCIYVLVARKFGASWAGTALFLLAPPVWLDLSWGNLNSLTLLGLLLPPWLGLFFLAIKPQVGIGYALFLFFQSWHEGGLWKVIKVFAPVGLALGLSVAIFGFWPATQYKPAGANPNISFWPWALPLGLWLLVRGLRTWQAKVSAAASPFLAPYTSYSGYVVTLLPMLNNTFELGIIVVGMYLTSIVRLIVGY